MRPFYALLIVLFFACSAPTYAQNASRETDKIIIFAAASLTDVLSDIAHHYEMKTNKKWAISFAGSSALARQIQQGAPADIFISADEIWMNEVQKTNDIDPTSRINLLSNDLVLITSSSSPLTSFDVNEASLAQVDLSQRITTGEVNSVPIGHYAKQALSFFNQWEHFKPALIETDNVRASLNLVSRREVGLGIVYATDAALMKDVKIIATFPATSHDPIIYPIALTRHHSTDANDALRFLTSEDARAIFTSYGFKTP